MGERLTSEDRVVAKCNRERRFRVDSSHPVDRIFAAIRAANGVSAPEQGGTTLWTADTAKRRAQLRFVAGLPMETLLCRSEPAATLPKQEARGRDDRAELCAVRKPLPQLVHISVPNTSALPCW